MADALDLRDLRYFEVIAELGHMGRAARALNRTQPALTGCVRRLEATLGTTLFERIGRNIRLTAAGEALLARARSLRIASEDAMREIADLGKGLAGLVRIGVVPTAARFLLPPVCRENRRDIALEFLAIARIQVLAWESDNGDLPDLLDSDFQCPILLVDV